MCNPSSVGTSRCLSGNTLVALADGTSQTFKQLASTGADVNVLCVDVNGIVVVRRMRQPRMTEARAEVYEAVLENGASFTGTAGHPVLLADHSDRELGVLEREKASLWCARREGELIIRADVDRYRALDAVEVPAENPGRSLPRVCEFCGSEFTVPFVQRAQVHCSSICENAHKDKLRRARQSSTAKYDSLRVHGVHRVRREDVYNGAVDEFHNFCLVVNTGKSTIDTLICVHSI